MHNPCTVNAVFYTMCFLYNIVKKKPVPFLSWHMLEPVILHLNAEFCV